MAAPFLVVAWWLAPRYIYAAHIISFLGCESDWKWAIFDFNWMHSVYIECEIHKNIYYYYLLWIHALQGNIHKIKFLNGYNFKFLDVF